MQVSSTVESWPTFRRDCRGCKRMGSVTLTGRGQSQPHTLPRNQDKDKEEKRSSSSCGYVYFPDGLVKIVINKGQTAEVYYRKAHLKSRLQA